MNNTFRIFAAWLILCVGAPITRGQTLDRAPLDAAFREEIEKVVKICDQFKLPQLAAATRSWDIARDPHRIYVFIPDRASTHNPKPDAAKIHHQWFKRLTSLRKAHAKKLFDLAGRALDEKKGTLAYQLVHEVLHFDPDHKEARRILGYRQISGKWSGPKLIKKASRSRISHPKVGFSRGKYWQIDSVHFRIATNLSKQAGIRLAHKLEDLHATWRQIFFDFWSSTAALKRRFKGKGRLPRIRRHDVVLFRNKKDYVQRLTSMEPRIAQTVGLFMQNHREAYFYAGDASVESIWMHEATHQLFHEIWGQRIGQIGIKANFWIVEGMALYMESLCEHSGYWTVGGFDADRIQFARYRALNENFYLPLQQLVKLNRKALQSNKDIRKLYSQSAGLTHFLMNGNSGKRRAATIRYLRAIYQGRDRVTSLASSTGDTLPNLDKQYRRFLVVSDAALSFLNPPDRVRRLSLGLCPVTDKGLVKLSSYKYLSWLGLSHTKITDVGINKILPGLQLIETLDLENTATSDLSLAAIGRLTKLSELDLSGTRISDRGAKHLGALKKLTILWLTNTPITDEALPNFYGLSKLRQLDVSRTKVTAAGIRKLRARLPKLIINGK